MTIPSAPWPEDSTAGETRPSVPTARPPIAGRHQVGTLLRRNSSSVRVTPRMIATPTSAHTIPSARIGM